MKLFTALKLFGVIDNTLTRQDIKLTFRDLAKENHPDHGGDAEMMKLINEAFEVIKDNYTFRIDKDENFENDENFWKIDDPEMEAVYKNIAHLEGIEIEICGYWMWVTGETYKVKFELKNAGLLYARKKIAWFWKPADRTSKSKGKTSLSDIRSKYGSNHLPASHRFKLA